MRRLNLTWANLSLRAKGLVVLAIPIDTLLLASVLFFQAHRSGEDAERWVHQFSEVRAEIQAANGCLVSASSATRAFLVTGSRTWLASHKDAARSLPRAFARLEQALHDVPGQAQRVRRLEERAQRALSALAALHPYAAVPGGGPARPPRELLVQSEVALETIRRDLAALEADQDRILVRRAAWNQQVATWTRVAFGLVLLCGLAGGALGVTVLATGVAGRVRRLKENALRLEAEAPLLPLPPGNDEIGRLGRALEEAANHLAERRARLRLALEGGRIALWELDSEGRFSVEADAGVLASLGFAPGDLHGRLEECLRWVHAGERDAVRAALARALCEGSACDVEFRMVSPNGAVRWFAARGRRAPTDGPGPARLLGVVVDITGRRHAEDALRRAREAAERAYRRERRIAVSFQSVLLPRGPVRLPGYAVAHTYRPALTDEADVGGDFYNIFDIGVGQTGIVMGDVAGKGLEAAVVAARVQQSVMTLALRERDCPAAVLDAVREVALASEDVGLVTVFFGVLDQATGTLRYSAAGHEPPLLWQAHEQRVVELAPDAPAICAVAVPPHLTREAVLAPGDLLLLYTDGLPDARPHHTADPLGWDAVERLLAAHHGQEPSSLLEALYHAAVQHSGGHLHDDIALVAIRRLEPSGGLPLRPTRWVAPPGARSGPDSVPASWGDAGL